MNQHDWLVEQFELARPHLRAVAYRMLGSLAEADDAVQEAWLHLSRADTSDVRNLTGWLTTVVSRICLDLLKARKARREEALEAAVSEFGTPRASEGDPEEEAILADSVGLALLVVLDTLNPLERLAFVLHDIFALSFEEIAKIVERSPMAARQLASRARRRLRGADIAPDADVACQREVVEAFLTAARTGNFTALLGVLDPGIVLHTDNPVLLGGEVSGAPAVARHFLGRAQGARPALVGGAVGVIVAPNGQLRLALVIRFTEDKIAEISVISERGHLSELAISVLDGA